MDLIFNPTTASKIKKTLPLSVVIQDMFTKTSEIRIEIKMPNYEYSSFLMFSNESGSKFSLSIKGKPGFCLASLHNLVASAKEHSRTGTHVDIFRARVNEICEWQLKTPLSDCFKSYEELIINFTGAEYEKTSYLIGKHESGPKFSVTIKGAPGFTQLAAAQIQGYAPLLKNMLTVALSGN